MEHDDLDDTARPPGNSVGAFSIPRTPAMDMLLNEHAHLFNHPDLRKCPLRDLEAWVYQRAFEEGIAAILAHFEAGGKVLRPFRFVVQEGQRRLRENEVRLEAIGEGLDDLPIG